MQLIINRCKLDSPWVFQYVTIIIDKGIELLVLFIFVFSLDHKHSLDSKIAISYCHLKKKKNDRDLLIL